MRNLSNRLFRYTHLLSLIVASLFAVGCTIVEDSTLGSNMMPEEQVMVMRHLKFQGNNKIYFNSEKGTNETLHLDGKNLLETRLYRTDSLLASNVGYGCMGVRRSNILGERSASFASTLLYMNAIDETNGFGYKPIFDTMFMILTVKDYGGDTIVPIRYKVYRLNQSLAGNVLKYDEKRQEDSVAYINCDLSGVYNPNEPIFEFTFPTNNLKQGLSTVMIPMTPTKYAWSGMVRELMLVPENYMTEEWDGYGNKGIEIYKDDAKWSNKFFGLYIEPDLSSVKGNAEGAIYSLDLEASGLMLQGRSRNPKDPSMIQDTVGMFYYFYDEASAYNASVNSVKRDYTNSYVKAEDMDSSKPREERRTFSTCCVDGLGGAATEIYLTDDFLTELVSLRATEQGEYSRVGVNQCLLTIYVKGADYDWSKTQSNAEQLIPVVNNSFVRLGSYLNYATLSPIIDYNYVYESTYDTEIPYNGYLDRSRGCYVLNITAHIQSLFNSIRAEDGSYDISKAHDKLRTLYIGAEATNPYSVSESLLQGMPEDESGNSVDAPIQIDLTYTLIK